MLDDPKDPAPAAATKAAYTIIKQKKSRWWEVRDPGNELVCLTVYRKGARVVRPLAPHAPDSRDGRQGIPARQGGPHQIPGSRRHRTRSPYAE